MRISALTHSAFFSHCCLRLWVRAAVRKHCSVSVKCLNIASTRFDQVYSIQQVRYPADDRIGSNFGIKQADLGGLPSSKIFRKAPTQYRSHCCTQCTHPGRIIQVSVSDPSSGASLTLPDLNNSPMESDFRGAMRAAPSPKSLPFLDDIVASAELSRS